MPGVKDKKLKIYIYKMRDYTTENNNWIYNNWIHFKDRFSNFTENFYNFITLQGPVVHDSIFIFD